MVKLYLAQGQQPSIDGLDGVEIALGSFISLVEAQNAGVSGESIVADPPKIDEALQFKSLEAVAPLTITDDVPNNKLIFGVDELDPRDEFGDILFDEHFLIEKTILSEYRDLEFDVSDASYATITEADAPGILRSDVNAGVSKKGVMTTRPLGGSSTVIILPTTGIWTLHAKVRMPPIEIADFGSFYFGLSDDWQAANIDNGILLGIEAGTDNWQLISLDGGIRSDVDTGIAFVPDEFIKIQVQIKSSNGISCKIDDTAVSNTVTTNIPNVAMSLGTVLTSAASGSTNPIQVDFDYLRFYFND